MKKYFLAIPFIALSLIFAKCWIVSKPITATGTDISGITNITARADYLYNITWTSKATFKGWKGLCTYYEGETYHLPYSQGAGNRGIIYWFTSADKFLNVTENADSAFYNLTARYGSPYYGLDCSGFVSYCWDLPKRATTATWETLDATNLGECTWDNVGKIEQGDALNIVNDDNSHVILISRINEDGTYEVTQQSYPDLRRNIYTAEQLVNNFNAYTIYRYNLRDSVSPPPEDSFSVDTAGIGKNFPAILANDDWLLLGADKDFASLMQTDTKNPQERFIWRVKRSNSNDCAVYHYYDGRVLKYGDDGYTLTEASENEEDDRCWKVLENDDGTYTLTAKSSGVSLYIWQMGMYDPITDPEIHQIANIGESFTAEIIHINSGCRLATLKDHLILTDGDNPESQWRFERTPNSTYVIYNSANGKVLDGAVSINKNTVDVSDFYNGDCQRWFLVEVQDGVYYFRRYHITEVLDINRNADDVQNKLKLSELGSTETHLFRLVIKTDTDEPTDLPGDGSAPDSDYLNNADNDTLETKISSPSTSDSSQWVWRLLIISIVVFILSFTWKKRAL